MEIINDSTIENWEKSYRSNFINSLTGFKSASMIGTCNKEGLTNLAIFSSIIHIGSNPALIGFINRPRLAGGHTLGNIESTGVYTVNHISEEILAQAHQTSARYDGNLSEFAHTGLTTEFIENISAPFVKESRVKYALSLQEIIPIWLNGTLLVIGKIILVQHEPGFVSTDGFVELDKAGSVCCNGNDTYYTTTRTARYGYAKPGLIPAKII